VKERFNIDMTIGHISTTKGELRRARKKPGAKKAAALKSEAGPPAVAAPAAVSPVQAAA
jgi:hypothetical protein